MYEPSEFTLEITRVFASLIFAGGFYANYYFNNQIFEHVVVGQLSLILLYCVLDQITWGAS